MSKQREFVVTVRQLVPTHRLNARTDRELNPRGAYQIRATSAQAALDAFYRTVPIGYTNDYEITVTELGPPDLSVRRF